MPHYVFDIDENDIVRGVYKDGVLIETAAHLEMPQSIVRTYFTSAVRNLCEMTISKDDRESNRHHGLQAFLMSLVGVEAFLNIFFHLVGRERGLSDVIDLATSDRATIETKLSHLPRRAYGSPLPAQKRLAKKLRELYELRSQIVHPKWEPSSLAMPGIVFVDMVDNQQQLFEDREFCREALRWCLLVVARVCDHAAGRPTTGIVWQWTGLNDSNQSLSEALGIPAEGS